MTFYQGPRLLEKKMPLAFKPEAFFMVDLGRICLELLFLKPCLSCGFKCFKRFANFRIFFSSMRNVIIKYINHINVDETPSNAVNMRINFPRAYARGIRRFKPT